MTFALTCETPSKYCIEYSNGTLHDVWTFEFIALVSVVAAIGGYLRAAHLHRRGDNYSTRDGFSNLPSSNENYGDENHSLRRNEDGVTT